MAIDPVMQILSKVFVIFCIIKITVLTYSAGCGKIGCSRNWVLQKICAASIVALIKNKIKFSSYIRKFRMEQLQYHV